MSAERSLNFENVTHLLFIMKLLDGKWQFNDIILFLDRINQTKSEILIMEQVKLFYILCIRLVGFC